jgi:hypothetical protein
VPFAHLLDQVIDEAAGDAAALGCLDEVVRCHAIVANGTSADVQLAVYRQARDKGAERKDALASVSEWLAETTLGLKEASVRPGSPNRLGRLPRDQHSSEPPKSGDDGPNLKGCSGVEVERKRIRHSSKVRHIRRRTTGSVGVADVSDAIGGALAVRGGLSALVYRLRSRHAVSGLLPPGASRMRSGVERYFGGGPTVMVIAE